MDTSQDVKLTDTNQPCGLTIDSFLLTHDKTVRDAVTRKALPFAGCSVEELRRANVEVQRLRKWRGKLRHERKVPAGVCSAATL